ncbi:hypothetical protein LTS18_009290 [Coniosporium uncinatum]|uniref:Uncharacterized protein n=1 Tax=Coniosporium uncinatum TaxID=93489 RepID=A0ACC3DYP3_9PEZI|nr:hypothetical protein LTS18_009290 [Coniosporium uncinatum]
MNGFGDVGVSTDPRTVADDFLKDETMNASTVSSGDFDGSPTLDLDWSTFDLEPPYNVFCPDAGGPFDFGSEMGFLNLGFNVTGESQASPRLLFHENEGSSSALSAKDMLVAVSQAFKQSLWRWHPEAQDYLTIEQPNLSLPTFILDWSKTLNLQGSTPVSVKLGTSTRDKILAMWLRRAGWYKDSSYQRIVPQPEDEGAALEAKWRQWIEQESFKRLVWATPLSYKLLALWQTVSILVGRMFNLANL